MAITKIETTPARKRRPKLPELWGAYEVAEELEVAPPNISPGAIANGKGPAGLPTPIAEVKATRLWLADEIREFAAEYKARRMARL